MDVHSSPSPPSAGPTPTPPIAAEPREASSLASRLADSAIILGLGSAAAFALGHSYELGFAKASGVPVDLVTVGPSAMLNGAAATAAIALAVFALKLFFDQLTRRWKFVMGGAALVAMVLGVLVFGLQDTPAGVIFSILACASTAIYLSSPLPTGRYQWMAVGSFLVIMVVGQAEGAGRRSAAAREEHVVFTDVTGAREFVLLRVYGEIAVLGSLDRDAGTVAARLRVTKLEHLDDEIATREHLGKLTLAKAIGEDD